MIKIILLVFLMQSYVMGMAESQSDKMYLRIVVTKQKVGALRNSSKFFCQEMQQFCTQKYLDQCCISRELVQKWAYEVIHQDTSDSQGFMRGFVGNKKYLESCVKMLKKGLGLQVMYHYKESQSGCIGLADESDKRFTYYECIGLTDVPAFLKGAVALCPDLVESTQQSDGTNDLGALCADEYDDQEDNEYDEDDDEIIIPLTVKKELAEVLIGYSALSEVPYESRY